MSFSGQARILGLLPPTINSDCFPVRAIEDSVVPADGGKASFRLNAFVTTLVFENPSGSRIRFDWLAADGGIAYRCRIPGDGGTPAPAWRVAAVAGGDTASAGRSGFAEALKSL